MTHEYAVSSAAASELLHGDDQFLQPAQLLRDLTEAQAQAVSAGSPCSIAQIVAHIKFYQDREIAGVTGDAPLPEPAHLDDTFAAPPPGEWAALVTAFLEGMEQCRTLAEEKAVETSRQREDTTVGYDLTGTALHNAYHLGQIVLLRRLQGLWPPAGGDTLDF